MQRFNDVRSEKITRMIMKNLLKFLGDTHFNINN